MPAYKFGTSSRLSLIDKRMVTPGPGIHLKADNISTFRNTSCNWSIAKPGSTPGYNSKSISPKYQLGPGAQNLSGDISKEGSQYSMRIKSKSFSALGNPNTNPGPGNYNSDSGIVANQQYSFGAAINNKFVTTMITPGPGAQSNMPVKRKPKTTKIGLEMKDDATSKHLYRSHYNHCNVPGPGNQIQGGDPELSPSTIFGKEERSNSLNITPGPGLQEHPNFVKDKIGNKFQGRYKDREFEVAIHHPGPNMYNINRNLDGPSYSQNQTAKFDTSQQLGPGPSTYVNDKSFKKLAGKVQSPQQSIGTSKRTNPKYFVPGPGQYNSNVGTHSNIAFSFGSKLCIDGVKVQETSPGPGNQSVRSKNNSQMKNEPMVSIGRSNRDDLTADKMLRPGPGNYGDKKDAGVLQSFGKDEKKNNNTNVGPGPGSQNIKGTIGV